VVAEIKDTVTRPDDRQDFGMQESVAGELVSQAVGKFLEEKRSEPDSLKIPEDHQSTRWYPATIQSSSQRDKASMIPYVTVWIRVDWTGRNGKKSATRSVWLVANVCDTVSVTGAPTGYRIYAVWNNPVTTAK
jgi:hypothetical protein